MFVILVHPIEKKLYLLKNGLQRKSRIKINFTGVGVKVTLVPNVGRRPSGPIFL